jgi:hypothetical protein
MVMFNAKCIHLTNFISLNLMPWFSPSEMGIIINCQFYWKPGSPYIDLEARSLNFFIIGLSSFYSLAKRQKPMIFF